MSADSIELIPRCEVCGQPATSMSQDSYVRDNYETGCIEARPSGILHYGCNAHPAESRQIDVTVSPMYPLGKW